MLFLLVLVACKPPSVQEIDRIQVSSRSTIESSQRNAPPQTKSILLPNNLSTILDLSGDRVCIQLQSNVRIRGEASTSYAVDAGRLSDVSRIHFNGQLLGGRGQLSPYRSGAFRPQMWVIPEDLIQTQNTLRVELCNVEGKYPIQAMDPIRIGPTQEIWHYRTAREIVAFVFLSFYLLAAVQHLWLGLRRKKEKYHIAFSGYLLVVSAYWFVAETLSRDLVFGDNVLWHRKTEYILLFFIVPLFLLFLIRFSDGRGRIVGRLAMGIAAILAGVTVFADIHTVRICGWIWQFGFLALSPYLAILAYRQLLRPFPYARLMTGAVLLLLASAIHDILVSLNILHSMRISSYSLAFLVLGLILLLGDQLVQATNRSEKLLSHATRLNLEMLKKNIHPHFLANSLNSAVELVHENPQRAEKLLMALVDEMRSTIELSDQELCPLETEIQLCRNHIEVMSLRMEKDLRLEAYGNLEAQIPPLVLLTIIENGITHGFRKRQQGLFTVNVRRYDHEVFVVIENDGDTGIQDADEGGVSPERRKFKRFDEQRGTGTRYIESRLEEMSPGQWQLHREVREGTYRVWIKYREPGPREKG